MKIGIFDSGLGGLVIAKSIIKKLPQYDYIYLGDTKRVPYGNRSQKEIYEFTRQAVNFLFGQNCQIIILACNSASARALRKIQQEYLPKNFPERRVLGVIIPTLEAVARPYGHIRANKGLRRGAGIGLIGTNATIKSHIYKKELKKINSRAKIFELATPLLVPLIEGNSLQKAQKTLELYLGPLQKQRVEALILGCTHYPILKNEIKRVMGAKVTIVSQDEIIPGKLANYLKRHTELSKKLSKNKKREFLVTSKNKNFDKVAERLFGKKLQFKLAGY